jgi:hypothetical protein
MSGRIGKTKVLRCPCFHIRDKSRRCQFKIRLFHNLEDGSIVIQVPQTSFSHTGHDDVKFKETSLYSPSTAEKGNKSLVSKFRLEGIPVSASKELRKRRRCGIMRKKCKRVKHNIFGTGSTWGDLSSQMERLKKSKIIADGRQFDENTPFLCGGTWLAEPLTETCIAVISTENLLFNAYRQTVTGLDLFFGVDTSYRYTSKKWGLMPIKTIGINQQAHTIA